MLQENAKQRHWPRAASTAFSDCLKSAKLLTKSAYTDTFHWQVEWHLFGEYD